MTSINESAIELRNRLNRGSIGSSDNDDEDEDNFPLLNSNIEYQLYKPIDPPNTCCEKTCFLFSFTGIVFLTSISLMLSNNSDYIKLSSELNNNKEELVESVYGAIFMYTFCLILSCYIWYRKVVVREGERNPRFDV
jgi:hypothetical protein